MRGAWCGARAIAASRRRAAPARRTAVGSGSRSSSAAWVTSTGARASASMNAQPLRRVVRVERQIGAARLEDAEQPDHHLERALDAQPDHRLRPDPEPAQMVRQPVGVRLELAIAQRARPRTPPPPPRACAAPARQTAAGSVAAADRMRGRVPLLQDGARAPAADRIAAARSAAPASATAASQQPHQTLRQKPRRCAPLKQVGSVVEPQLQRVPGRTTRLSG